MLQNFEIFDIHIRHFCCYRDMHSSAWKFAEHGGSKPTQYGRK